MKTSNYLLAMAALVIVGLNGPAGAAGHSGGYFRDAAPHRFDQRVDRRQNRQSARIAGAVEDGELSRRETRRLRKEQRQIKRMERRFERDGYYSPRERRLLDRALDRASDRIERAKFSDHGRRHGRHRRGWHADHHGYLAPAYGYGEPDDGYVLGSASSTTVSAQTEGFSVSWSSSEQQ